MSFISQIPANHKRLRADLRLVELEIHALWEKLGDDETEIARTHSCDCEYCPYADIKVPPELSPKEFEEVEAEIDKLTSTKKDYIRIIKALENYAKSVGEPLPKEVLLP